MMKKEIRVIIAAGFTAFLLGWAPPSGFAAEILAGGSLAEARQLIKEDRLSEAQDQLSSLLAEHPSDFQARLELARLLGTLGEKDEALTHYEVLSTQNPENRKVNAEFAWMLMNASQFQRSVIQYDRLLKEEPRSVKLLLGRALALYGTGDVRKALAAYKAVLQIEPENIEAKVGVYELQKLVISPFQWRSGLFFVTLLAVILLSLVVMAYFGARPARPGRPKGAFGPFREGFIHFVAIVSLMVASYYFFWRVTSTMNWDAWWFSVPILVAELYGVFVAAMFFFMVWKPLERTPPEPLSGRSVDVFITTLNEDPKLLRRTILGCINITYPHETYVLDDGNRPEVAALAKELGCKYISRDTNTHAKAGNLNNAMRLTSGEFIVTLDADHVPLPNFLDRLTGYFRDENVAFVQSPQSFYNIDSFQHRVDKKRRRMWTEQSLFFSVIQPGKDYWNAAFYCGSCAILRRTSLEAVGGFAEGTVTEDIHTSILLHGKGFRSVYHNESLAYGLAPDTTKPFLVQRLRWGQGAMQVLVRDNPLWVKGLTLPQRISYFTSMTTYFDGYQKAIFYLAPLVYFVTGVLPILAFNVVFLMHFIPYFALFILSYELMSRGHGSTFRTEQYNMAKFWTFIRTTAGLFGKKRLRFKITPKTNLKKPSLWLLGPQLFVLAINLVGIGIGTFRYFWRGELVTMAFYGNVVWASVNIVLAAAILRFSRKKVQVRGTHRFLYLVPSSFSLATDSSDIRRVGLVLDCHEEGASLVTSKPILEHSTVDLQMTVGPREINAKGVVVTSNAVPGGKDKLFRQGVRFTSISPEDQDYLVQYGFEFLIPRLMQSYRQITTVFDRLDRYVRHEQRKDKRWVFSLPITIHAQPGEGGEKVPGVTYEIGDGGLSVLCMKELPLSTPVEFTISLMDRPITGKGELLRGERVLSAGSEMYRYSMKFSTEQPIDIKPLKEFNVLLERFKGV